MFIIIPSQKLDCIDLVVISEKLRRQGKGTAPVRQFMAPARGAGAKAVVAEIDQFDGSLSVESRQTFFAKLGFKVDPINEDEHDIPALFMVAEL
jgi:N-acetylglutamate synthase-like GNAT family acetyltransferase